MHNIKIKKLFFVIPSISLLIFIIIILSSCNSENISKNSTPINQKNGIYTLTSSWFYNHNIKSLDHKQKYAETWIDIGDKKLREVEEFNKHREPFLLKRDIIIKDNKNKYGILVPFHYTGAQFYFNDKKIYETSPLEKVQYPPITGKPFFTGIPNNIINEGKNSLIIETTDLLNFNDFYKEIEFGDYHALNRKWILSLLWYCSIAAVCFFLSFYNLFFFLKRKKEKHYLSFSLFSLSFGLWVLGYKGITLWISSSQFFHIAATYPFMICGIIFGITFIHDFLSIRYNIFIKTLMAILISLLIASFADYVVTGTIYYFKKYLFNLYILVSIITIITAFIETVISYKKRVLFSDKILLGWGFLFLSIIITTLRFFDIILIYPIMIESIFFVIIAFSSILTSRFAQLHTDLEATHGELLVLDKLKDDFLATTTHELRTPLHGIIGLAENLTSGSLGGLNSGQSENLNLIMTSAERLNSLVSSILDFSKIRAGKADLLFEELSLPDVINSVVSLLRKTAQDKGITLAVDCAPLPRIRADRNRVYQVLVNLIGNAIKFTPRGSILVRARQTEEDAVSVEVTDTGIGIDREGLVRIWQPFAQAEDPDTRSAGGTGLGLAITKHLVEMHGGRIWAESEKGKGSTFAFELPFNAKAAGIQKTRLLEPEELRSVSAKTLAALSPEQAEERPMKTKYPAATLLAVDDDPVNLRVLDTICAAADYNLLTAATGPEALDRIERGGIDLVLLDLMLPGMSGYEVCQKIRETGDDRFIPVIILTARDHLGDMVQGFETGANDYVTKPFRRRELLSRIENQLAIKQLLDMEKSAVTGLRKERDAITGLLQKSIGIKESALQTFEWEKLIREDMDVAREFQLKLMMHESDIPGIESHVCYRPLLEVGGDLYDIFELEPGLIRIFLADATGHGISASLNTVKILTEYASLKKSAASPREALDILNQRFARQIGSYIIIFTCLIADVNLKDSTVTIASAGLPRQYLLNSTAVVPIRAQNPILGVSENIIYKQNTYDFGQGDMLFLYTDGLYELAHPQVFGNNADWDDDEDMFSNDLPRIYKNRGIVEASADLADRFCEGKTLNDDVTFIALRRSR
jgi:two-component system sensor histidine kinase ChiS